MKAAGLARKVMTHQNYSIHVLTPEYKQQAIQLMARSFTDMHPLLKAIEKRKDLPKGFQVGYDVSYRYWVSEMDQQTSNGLSVMILDDSNNGQFVGTLVCKDYTKTSKAFEEVINGNNYFNPPCAAYLRNYEKLRPEIKALTEQNIKGKLFENCAGGLKPEHTGKRLQYKLVEASEILAREQGFQNVIAGVDNPRTAAGLKTLGYQMVAQTDVRQFEYQGIKIMSQVPEEYKYSEIWFKKYV